MTEHETTHALLCLILQKLGVTDATTREALQAAQKVWAKNDLDKSRKEA